MNTPLFQDQMVALVRQLKTDKKLSREMKESIVELSCRMARAAVLDYRNLANGNHELFMAELPYADPDIAPIHGSSEATQNGISKKVSLPPPVEHEKGDKYGLKKMEVGDCLEFDYTMRSKLNGYAHVLAQFMGWKIKMKQSKREGYIRIWRIS